MQLIPAPPERFGELIDLTLRRCPAMERPSVAAPLEDPAATDWKVVLMAVEADEIVGWGAVLHLTAFPPRSRSARIVTAPGHEGQGIGGALWAALFAKLDETSDIRGGTQDDDPRSLEVARRWGFEVLQHSITSRLDLARVRPVDLPAGVTLEECPTLEFRDSEAVAAMLQASQTNPERAFLDMDFAFLLGMLGSTETAVGALLRVDGAPVAISYGGVVGTEAHLGYTGVHPAHRGHGFGAMVKQHVHTLAVQAGATVCFTDNEEHNLGIRHVNESLGYQKDYGRYWLRRTA
jgi:GNAT superfamily N-acetyltransferase